jgi:rhodanese-related sulfurtransferase
MGLFDLFRRRKPVTAPVEDQPLAPQLFEDIEPSQVMTLVAGGSRIVDVRTTREFAGYHIAGAQHVPLDDIRRNATALPEGDNLIFVCEVGGRSAYAASLAAASGRSRIYNLDGGMQAWLHAGLPTDPPVS